MRPDWQEHLDRLTLMVGPASHEKWDLSDNDKAAIGWALSRVEELTNGMRLVEVEVQKQGGRAERFKAALELIADGGGREKCDHPAEARAALAPEPK